MKKVITFFLVLGNVLGWGIVIYLMQNLQSSTTVNKNIQTSAFKFNGGARSNFINSQADNIQKGNVTFENYIYQVNESIDYQVKNSSSMYKKLLKLNSSQIEQLEKMGSIYKEKEIENEKRRYDKYFKNGQYDYENYDWETEDQKKEEIERFSLRNRINEILTDEQKEAYKNYKENVKKAEIEAYATNILAMKIREEGPLTEAEKDKLFLQISQGVQVSDDGEVIYDEGNNIRQETLVD